MRISSQKKICYIPGIYGLIFLVFVCIYFAKNEIKSHQLMVVQIFLADMNLIKQYPELFKDYEGQFPPTRNYVDIFFTGNGRNDKIKLDSAQLRIREILSQNDLSNGAHFHFGDSSLLSSFVKSTDVLRNEGLELRRRWTIIFGFIIFVRTGTTSKIRMFISLT